MSNRKGERRVELGDFNINHPAIRTFLPELFDEDTEEIELPGPTTPKKRQYDHIIFRGMRLLGVEIDDAARTDHYPVTARFEI
ncbi:MAG: hypothetical protein ABWX94_01955 [Candidatus Saccharimonadales bacterium]